MAGVGLRTEGHVGGLGRGDSRGYSIRRTQSTTCLLHWRYFLPIAASRVCNATITSFNGNTRSSTVSDLAI